MTEEYNKVTIRNEGELMDYKIIAIKIDARTKHAAEVQRLLTEHGCMIKVRLGLHDLPEGSCSTSGLIILEVVESDLVIGEFIEKLNILDQVTAKYLSL